MTIKVIKVYDNYDNDKSTTIVATERKSARPWITKHQLKVAEERVGMIGGSCLRASRDLLDAGYDGIDVYDGNLLVGEIRA